MAKKPRDQEEYGHAVTDSIETGLSRDAINEMASELLESERYARSVLNGGEDPIEAGGLPKAIADNEAKKTKKTPEEKLADFSRLASARVSRALDALNALNHLSSIQSYDWTEEAKDKIFATLREKIDTVEASFVEAKAPTEGRKKTSKLLSFRV